MGKFKLKSFDDFKKHCKSEISIGFVKLSDEEFIRIMKPIICDICQRLFNSNKKNVDKEKEDKLNDFEDFYWEVIF